MSEELSTKMKKMSYALGMNMGQSLRDMPIDVDAAAAIKGMSDMLLEKPVDLTREEYVGLMQEYQEEMKTKLESAKKDMAATNQAQQDQFLKENKEKDGVLTTESGLQYEVLVEGEGEKPNLESTVRVHYTGTLLDGTVFDSSVQRGQPAEFGLKQVIRGWTEALLLMNKGSKYKLFLPSELAYGSQSVGNVIGPNSALVFEVELLDIL